MMSLGILFAALDLWLWRLLSTGSGRLAVDAICTGYVGRIGRRYGAPFWNGTVTVARSLSSIGRSGVHRGRCMFTRSTARLILTISATTRRLARRITRDGTTYDVAPSGLYPWQQDLIDEWFPDGCERPTQRIWRLRRGRRR